MHVVLKNFVRGLERLTVEWAAQWFIRVVFCTLCEFAKLNRGGESILFLSASRAVAEFCKPDFALSIVSNFILFKHSLIFRCGCQKLNKISSPELSLSSSQIFGSTYCAIPAFYWNCIRILRVLDEISILFFQENLKLSEISTPSDALMSANP